MKHLTQIDRHVYFTKLAKRNKLKARTVLVEEDFFCDMADIFSNVGGHFLCVKILEKNNYFFPKVIRNIV